MCMFFCVREVGLRDVAAFIYRYTTPQERNFFVKGWKAECYVRDPGSSPIDVLKRRSFLLLVPQDDKSPDQMIAVVSTVIPYGEDTEFLVGRSCQGEC